MLPYFSILQVDIISVAWTEKSQNIDGMDVDIIQL